MWWAPRRQKGPVGAKGLRQLLLYLDMGVLQFNNRPDLCA